MKLRQLIVTGVFLILAFSVRADKKEESNFTMSQTLELHDSEILDLGLCRKVDSASYYMDEKGKMRVMLYVPYRKKPARVWNSIGYMGIGCVVSMGILLALPEDFTNWHKEDMKVSKLGKKYRDNVSNGPVWDQDDLFLNYVMHPYFGGVYYNISRAAGYPWWSSALMSLGLSTFFWEYGFEAFAEKPSQQDLILTPVAGSLIGELMYHGKLRIKKNNDRVLGSLFLGRFSLYLLDPVNEIQDSILRGRIKKKLNPRFSMQSGITFQNAMPSLQLTVNF